MNVNTPLVSYIGDSAKALPELVDFFALQHNGELWNPEVLLYADFLEKLVFQVSRKPKLLTAHLQRIYYCFHTNLNEQLFAAIVDFLIILNRRGIAVSRRVTMATKSQLDSNQTQELMNYLEDGDANVYLLVGNQYSLFTKGLLGANEMIRQIEKNDDDNKYDPLSIAHDYIEYSQLDEAKEVLEEAVLTYPDRLDFQCELLQLYQSTRDSSGFHLMFANLTESGAVMFDEWDKLNNYFKGQNSNG